MHLSRIGLLLHAPRGRSGLIDRQQSTRRGFRWRRNFVVVALLLSVAGACGERAEPPPRESIPGQAPGEGRGEAFDDVGDDAEGMVEVLVYFTRGEEPDPHPRMVEASDDQAGLLETTLEQLLAGPTAEERERGTHSWFSEATAGRLKDVSIDEDGMAFVDFQDFSSLIPGAGSSFGSLMLLQELNYTVFQFSGIGAVEYRFEGSCEAFWNWIQRSCEVVRRASH